MWHRQPWIKIGGAMMQLGNYIRIGTTPPSPIPLWKQWLTALMCFIAILLTSAVTHLTNLGQTPILVASMGASAMIMLAIPSSPFAQPWAFVGGQLVSALIGVTVACYVPDTILAPAVAVGLAVLIMQHLRCLHPPGAATVLAPVLSNLQPSQPDFSFVLNPLGINVTMILILVLLINRLMLRHDYPARPLPDKTSQNSITYLAGVSPTDIIQATHDTQQIIDVSSEELSQIFTRLQLMNYAKHHQLPICRDIVQRGIITVDYATEVESAWLTMDKHGLNALPVLDRSRRIIGMVTRYDFLKHLQLNPHESLYDKWSAFIKPTTGLYSNKPEAIGHIMNRKVKSVPASASIIELIPLVINEGHHHIPVVDDENRFVGMIFLRQLVSELFGHQLANLS